MSISGQHKGDNCEHALERNSIRQRFDARGVRFLRVELDADATPCTLSPPPPPDPSTHVCERRAQAPARAAWTTKNVRLKVLARQERS